MMTGAEAPRTSISNIHVRNVGTCPEDLGSKSTRQAARVSASSVTDVVFLVKLVRAGSAALVVVVSRMKRGHTVVPRREWLVNIPRCERQSERARPGQHLWSCKGKCSVCSGLWMACRRKHIRRCDYVFSRSQDVTRGPSSLESRRKSDRKSGILTGPVYQDRRRQQHPRLPRSPPPPSPITHDPNPIRPTPTHLSRLASRSDSSKHRISSSRTAKPISSRPPPPAHGETATYQGP